MKTIAEFRDFYNNDLASNILKIAESGKILQDKMLKASMILGILTALATCTFLLPIPMMAAVITAAVFVIADIIAFVHFYGKKKELNGLFKFLVVKKIIEFADPGLKYSPAGYVSQGLFAASGIYNQSIDRYEGEDLICGTYNNVELQFSEIKVCYKQTTRDSKGNTHTTYVPFFDGVFFVADFNKDFKSTTLVLPDTTESIFGQLVGNFLQKCNIMRSGKLIRMEDSEFEKCFVVYGADDIESRYILTPKIMRAMIDIRERLSNAVAFAFVGSRIFITIPNSRNLFEMESLVPTYQEAEAIFLDVMRFTYLVDELSLDLRIWTKV